MLAPIEEIFCEIDDFCNEILKEEERILLADPHRIPLANEEYCFRLRQGAR